MLILRKIKELKGYRFFQNFKWDESGCDLLMSGVVLLIEKRANQ